MLQVLNDEQIEILGSVIKNSVSLIQGPPGTGKTTLITRIALSLYNRLRKARKESKRNKILVIADSNQAVNNLVENLLKAFKELESDAQLVRLMSTVAFNKAGYNTKLIDPYTVTNPKHGPIFKFIKNTKGKLVKGEMIKPSSESLLKNSDIVCCTTPSPLLGLTKNGKKTNGQISFLQSSTKLLKAKKLYL